MSRRLFAFAALALSALGFYPSAAQSTPRFEAADCSFSSPRYQVQCGDLIVPEDRSNPADTKTIKLAVAILKSTSSTPAPDPVIYLEGGPGASDIKSPDFIIDAVAATYLPQRDVLLFDQRGIGASQPALDCPEITDLSYQVLDQELSIDQSLQMYNDAAKACASRLKNEGINLAAYTSAQSAADVADLRAALGYQQVNLVGISYGTRLALTVMRDHPEGIRSVIIDSVVPLQVSGFDVGQNADRAFNALFDACAADTTCNAKYPDLNDVFYNLVDQLNRQPAHFQLPDPRHRGLLDAVGDGNALMGAVFQAMYSSEFIPHLPAAIYAVKDGDYTLLSYMTYSQLSELDQISEGMYLSVQCSEEYPFDTPETVNALLAKLSPQLQNFARLGDVDPSVFTMCQAWGTKQPNPVENQPVTSSIPTLVMSGSLDPITPPAYGKMAAATLSNGHFFEYPSLGHGTSIADDCPRNMAAQFIDDPTRAPDSSCIAAMLPPAFQ
jgi:pimeloyl-ACP methyl ester carboxylesterase